jgi:hypothetical protein
VKTFLSAYLKSVIVIVIARFGNQRSGIFIIYNNYIDRPRTIFLKYYFVI